MAHPTYQGDSVVFMNMIHPSTLKRCHFVLKTDVGLISTIFDTTKVNVTRTCKIFAMSIV